MKKQSPQEQYEDAKDKRRQNLSGKNKSSRQSRMAGIPKPSAHRNGPGVTSAVNKKALSVLT